MRSPGARCHTVMNPASPLSPRSPMGALSPVRVANATNAVSKSRSIKFMAKQGGGSPHCQQLPKGCKGGVARLKAEHGLHDDGATRPPTPIKKTGGNQAMDQLQQLQQQHCSPSAHSGAVGGSPAVSSPQDEGLVKRKRMNQRRGVRPPPLYTEDELAAESFEVGHGAAGADGADGGGVPASLNPFSPTHPEVQTDVGEFPFSPTHPESTEEKKFSW